MDINEKVILNAAVEICGVSNKLKKRIVSMYDAAPETFRKHRPKMGQFLIVTPDIDSFVKVASVLKEAKKKNGLAHGAIIEMYGDLCEEVYGVPMQEIPDCISEEGIGEFSRYNSFIAYLSMLFEAETACDEFRDSPRADREVLTATHSEPHFKEVFEVLGDFLSERPGAFGEEEYFRTCRLIHGVTSIAFLDKSKRDIPLHEVTTSRLTYSPIEDSADKATAFIDKEHYIRNVAGAEVSNLIIEWNLAGANGYQLVYDNPINAKELKRITELAFWHMKLYCLDYCRAEDLYMVISYAVSLYREAVFQKHYKELFTAIQKKTSPKESQGGTDAFTEKLESLSRENALLKRQLMVSRQNVDTLRGSLKDANKQIYKLNAQVPKPIEEEKVCIPEPTLEVLPEEESEGEKLNRFTEYVNGHKVLVWGCRENYIRSMEKNFPQITFMEAKPITARQLKAYDFVVMRTDFTGHSLFSKVKSIVLNSGLPMCYTAKGENSVASLVGGALKALDSLKA